jgi:octaprenyl-diphosphate synthase
VLVGDFLYSRAFQMMVEVDDMRVMQVLAEATNTIAGGEVLQLMGSHDPEVDEARYLEVIRRKTAKLFEAAARLRFFLTSEHSEQQIRRTMDRLVYHLEDLGSLAVAPPQPSVAE